MINRLRATFARAAFAAALALAGCGGGNHVASAIPAAAAPASTQRASMTVTVNRQNTTTTSSATRHTLTIPASANSVEVDAYSGTLSLPASGVSFTPPSGTTPSTTACANFPSGQTQATITAQVPVGAATIVISAYSGACSGNVSQGTLLSQASGSGTATMTGGDLGSTFFNSTNGVTLALISNNFYNYPSPLVALNPQIIVTSSAPIILESVVPYSSSINFPEIDTYCMPNFYTNTLPINIEASLSPAAQSLNTLAAFNMSMGYSGIQSMTINNQALNSSLNSYLSEGRGTGSIPDSYSMEISKLLPAAAGYPFSIDVSLIPQLQPAFGSVDRPSVDKLATNAYIFPCPSPIIQDYTQAGSPTISGTTQSTQPNTNIDLHLSAANLTIPVGYGLKSVQWTISGNPVSSGATTSLPTSALTQSEVKFAWTQPGTYQASASAVYANESGETISTNVASVTYNVAMLCSPVSTPGNCPQIGDIVIYRSGGNIVHSGVISQVGSDGKTVTKVRSKWGVYGLYEHDPDDVPQDYGTWTAYHSNRSGGNYLQTYPTGQMVGPQVGYETDSNPPEIIPTLTSFSVWAARAKSTFPSATLSQIISVFYGDTSSESITPTVDDANIWLYSQGLSGKVAMLAPPSLAYDCHGYTFTNAQAWVGIDTNHGQEIQNIINDNGYKAVQSIDSSGKPH